MQHMSSNSKGSKGFTALVILLIATPCYYRGKAARPKPRLQRPIHREGCYFFRDSWGLKTKFILKHLRFTDTVLLTHLKTA